uniref:Haloacid dehalogenase-like hydrolase domain-containing 5 n=2 Tax=Latimeria chalumnae TaxID=7897 RepID=H3AS69_LATCH
PSFGLLLDIDGVLVRGRTPIPAAREAFRKLAGPGGRLRVPVVFVTNAGNCLQKAKAEQLSRILGISVSPKQVLLSHTPLQMFQQFHDKHVLVSGQGPVLEIAKNLGFRKGVSIDALREAFPWLDRSDRNRRTTIASTPNPDFPRVEAVILFGEPIKWEINLQLIMDILLTNGSLSTVSHTAPYPHIPVLACNMDLLWAAEALTPRFGHGIFMLCLESLYKKVTGKKLKYEALVGKPSHITYQYAESVARKLSEEMGWTNPITTLYAIGDNPMTDIYGANLYNRLLKERTRKGSKARVQPKVAAVRGASTDVTQVCDPENGAGSETVQGSVTSCKSVLVCTGVYTPSQNGAAGRMEAGFHGHRDFTFDPELIEPAHVVEDISAAVDLVFELEKYSPL